MVEYKRVKRGGSWFNDDDFNLRLAYRVWVNPDLKFNDDGFRCVSSCMCMIHGGSWYYSNDHFLRSANRYYLNPVNENFSIGFRCTGRKTAENQEKRDYENTGKCNRFRS
jgi:formylglycine-generating enzyme required for sulfatase activity